MIAISLYERCADCGHLKAAHMGDGCHAQQRTPNARVRMQPCECLRFRRSPRGRRVQPVSELGVVGGTERAPDAPLPALDVGSPFGMLDALTEAATRPSLRAGGTPESSGPLEFECTDPEMLAEFLVGNGLQINSMRLTAANGEPLRMVIECGPADVPDDPPTRGQRLGYPSQWTPEMAERMVGIPADE